MKNVNLDRVVYVVPETLKDNPGKYKKIPPSELNDSGHLGDPKHPGQPSQAKRPQKPHRPAIERDPPPARIHPPIPAHPPEPAKRPKPVPPLKLPKVPEPDKPQEWKKEKRYLSASVVRVMARWLNGV